MLERIVDGDLILRRPALSDADDITQYCKDEDFAKTTLRVPHPYDREDAVAFIQNSSQQWEAATSYTYVIEHDGKVIGGIDLRLEQEDKASLGYGIGRASWGQGITTRAVRLIVDEGFKSLPLNRIYAEHWTKNPASGRVMQKAGMTYEGTLKQHHKRGNEYWDVCVYGILRSEWKSL